MMTALIAATLCSVILMSAPAAARATSEDFSKSHGMWRSVCSERFVAGFVRERLQKCAAGFSFAACSRYALPKPEEPPVTMTATNERSVSGTEGMARWR